MGSALQGPGCGAALRGGTTAGPVYSSRNATHGNVVSATFLRTYPTNTGWSAGGRHHHGPRTIRRTHHSTRCGEGHQPGEVRRARSAGGERGVIRTQGSRSTGAPQVAILATGSGHLVTFGVAGRRESKAQATHAHEAMPLWDSAASRRRCDLADRTPRQTRPDPFAGAWRADASFRAS